MGASSSTKHSTIMLLDDNEIDNFVNKKVLQNNNFAERIYTHTSSRSALEFLENLNSDDDVTSELIPEIIFVDINMPIMDGLQFLEEFERNSEAIADKVKIVMLTTSINPQDIEKCANNPKIIKYINKPLTKEHLDGI
ncbi:MAG: response regulator [Bacteroidetes bacterium]|nr:response regulator [Bacteroidota bacterium]